MADIVNLRQFRKRKTREDKAVVAEQNRAKFGRPKSEREMEAALKTLDNRRLDAHKREALSGGEGEDK